MLLQEEEKEPNIYFSVKHTYRIGGTNFRPSICHKIPRGCEKAIEELAAQGEARRYTRKQVFVSGVAHPVKTAAERE